MIVLNTKLPVCSWEIMVQKEKIGSVHAVLKSPNHGYPTYSQDAVEIKSDGIDGDAHSGPLRKSYRNPGTLKPNDRPISIVAKEVIDEMWEKFGLTRTMKPGGFNEQIVVEGLGDLADAGEGDTLLFEGGVMLEIVEGAMPCNQLNEFHGEPMLAKALAEVQPDGTVHTKRGALAKVLIPGMLMPGEVVTISPPVKSCELYTA